MYQSSSCAKLGTLLSSPLEVMWYPQLIGINQLQTTRKMRGQFAKILLINMHSEPKDSLSLFIALQKLDSDHRSKLYQRRLI